ncbi:MAG: hypothetical protein ACRD1Y_12415 [Terriglobales bacterium]
MPSSPGRNTHPPRAVRFALVALVVIVLAYLTWSSTHTARHSVTVCVTYQGLSACRSAEGRTMQEALRAAHDNACSQITSGVTGTLGCQNTPATHVTYIR